MPNDGAVVQTTAPNHGSNKGTRWDYRRGGAREAQPDRLYAALDLGTNNCRLLIAKPAREGFHVVDAFSRIVRLGEGLAATGQISDIAQDRAVDALKICADKLYRRNVFIMRHVATEACRRAVNTQDFVSRVYTETGLALDVISPAEEARLAVLGCQTLLPAESEYGLVFDIGGGSTELILVQKTAIPPGSHKNRGNTQTEILAWTSMPWGVVSLAESYGADSHGALAYEAMKNQILSYLVDFDRQSDIRRRIEAGQLAILGTSGTVTTLASLHLGLPIYDRRQVDGSVVSGADLHKLTRSLSNMSMAERAAIPCIGPERADLMVAGCAILEALLEYWPMGQVRIADRGIREGILRVLMQRDGILI